MTTPLRMKKRKEYRRPPPPPQEATATTITATPILPLPDVPEVRAAEAATEFESDDDARIEFGVAGNAALRALRPYPERGASVAAATPAPTPVAESAAPTPVAESAAPALALAVAAPARGRRPRCNRAARAHRRRCRAAFL
ncbi:hypothetical protein DL767_009492 [Monosporascus sp. MG133]|nr:hypothetical protein DL767_009492 [Monosporascus sp. MG133]